eukprot:3854999-Karenia_brevis.AAC.1
MVELLPLSRRVPGTRQRIWAGDWDLQVMEMDATQGAMRRPARLPTQDTGRTGAPPPLQAVEDMIRTKT